MLLVIPCMLLAQSKGDLEKEKEAIKKVIQKAYVDGLQNKGELSDIENGFHPGFELLGIRDNDLTELHIYSWIHMWKKGKAENPGAPDPKITCNYAMIDVTGTAAIAKIDLFKGDKQIFTDYLSLYKFDEGWKIVSKIYYRYE